LFVVVQFVLSHDLLAGEKRIVAKQGMPVLNKPDKFGDLYIEFQVCLRDL
jgi:hypothetical protein